MDCNHPLQSILGFISSQPGHNKHDVANLSEQWRGITELPPYQDCDRSVLLNNLVFLEQKVLDLQGVVKSMIHENPDLSDSEGVSVAILQQMVVAEIASIITQMISTAGRLLNLGQEKSKGKSCSELNPVIAQLSTLLGASGRLGAQNLQQLATGFFGFVTENCGGEEDCCNRVVEKPFCSVQEFEHGSAAYLDISITEVRKDETEDGEEENLLSSGCYEVLELEKEEILAPHTHFCLICGKGFKRDANLRMHMRGHGDMFKTPESLANPNKGAKLDLVQSRRYSCPFEGCKRNRKHKKFQPLKTILCVKNHYKRSHCDKSYICSRCNRKKFSIIADLKTHEKHCGEDKWMCSCGTSFSRKDKLFGHVSLFHGGHTPVLPMKEFDRCKIPDEETKCEGQRTSVIAQGAFGTGSVPSAKVSCGASYDQQVLADTHLQNEENKFHTAQPETSQSPSTLMVSPFSLQSLLSYSFIEPDGENSI